MRGFEIVKTWDEIAYVSESLPEKILKVPGIALVAAGFPSCLVTLHAAAMRAEALDRLFLCEISPVQYSLGKQGTKIWQAVERAGKMPGIRGIIIYASCMEVLTMWDFAGERRKHPCEVPVEVLYRGPMVKRYVKPSKELEKILAGWKISMNEGNEKDSSAHSEETRKEESALESEGTWKPHLPYYAEEILKLSDQDCDILLFTPGGCKSCLRPLPAESLKNLWNTRFSDYVLSRGNMEQIAEEILHKFPQERPLYLLEAEVMQFMGTDLKKFAAYLNKAGKETYYID